MVLESLRVQGRTVQVALLDASGDDRVRALAEHHSDWLAHRRHGPDSGQSDAIIEGWRALDGDWLGWLNADDLLMPRAIEQVTEALTADPSIDVIYGHSAILDSDGAMTGYHFNVEPPGPRLLSAGIISQPSCFFRRTSYEKVGGLNADLHFVMDWDLWIRLYESGARFAFIETCLSMVLWGQDTKTSSLRKRRRKELDDLIGRYAPEADQKRVFRDFIIHALSDRVYPKSLRSRLQRKLRSASGAPFGIRGDGALMERASIQYANYNHDPMDSVALEFEGNTNDIDLASNLGIKSLERQNNTIRIQFEQALAPGTTCEVMLNTPSQNETYFKMATWFDSVRRSEGQRD